MGLLDRRMGKPVREGSPSTRGGLFVSRYRFYQVDQRSSQPMKTKHDVILPGRGIYWIIGSIVGVCALLAFTGLVLVNTPDSRDGYVQPSESKTTITPDRQQEAVRAMADFMVKDNNVIGLRMWARSLGISSPEFSSTATLREEIRRASSDFMIYRDKNEMLRLVELLGSDAATLNEVVR